MGSTLITAPVRLYAEWTLDPKPICTAVDLVIGQTAQEKGLISPLVRMVVDYLESYQCFGEREWKTFCGSVAPAPLLPNGFSRIWNGPCPVFLGEKRMRDTHMLVYIPATVDGKPLTLKSLGEIAKERYFQTNEEGYRFIWPYIVNKLGNKPLDHWGWVVMTKDLIPQSRIKNYVAQQVLVDALAKKAFASYEIPRTLEASVCILTHYFSSQTRLFTDNPRTLMRCQENLQGDHLIVGGFSRAGLSVNDHSCIFDESTIGVAALCWLKESGKIVEILERNL